MVMEAAATLILRDDILFSRKISSTDAILLRIESAFCLLNSERVMLYKEVITAVDFRRLFGTVQIRQPRGAGHTTAAVLMLYAMDDAIVFVVSQQDSMHIKNVIHRMLHIPYGVRENMMGRVYFSSHLNPALYDTVMPAIIILDRASNFQTVDYNRIFSEFFDTTLIVELQ